ncbi:MAG: zf-TFIIB domain-containing protein [Phycisphaerae bacterium]|nr:zf-TFIIB domain-containing protein [Phycisphaerae bacterium]
MCSYCGTLNDTDLRAIHHSVDGGRPSTRICPRCNAFLDTVTIELGSPFQFERCDRCLGIFFDPAELDAVLATAVRQVDEINLSRLNALISEQGIPEPERVQYVKCPVCGEMMGRRGCGVLSGVVADRCAVHGLWLDGGEFGKLLKWAKAGGVLLTERRRLEQISRELRETRKGRFSTSAEWGRAPVSDPERSPLSWAIELVVSAFGRSC